MSHPTTGTKIRSGTCDDRPDNCIFFDTDDGDTHTHSHVFDVDEPMQIMAFDLPEGDRVTLQQVFGENEGTHFENVKVGSSVVQLNKCNNRVLIPFKGRFRLFYENGTPGTATIVCEPSDCCFADFFPKECNMTCCPETAAEIAAKLAFRTCAGGNVTPGEQLATCTDLAAAIAAAKRRYVNDAGAEHGDGACIPSCAEMVAADAAIADQIPTYNDAGGAPHGDGACIPSCAEMVAADAAIADQIPTYNDAGGAPHGDGACIPSCAEMVAADAAIADQIPTYNDAGGAPHGDGACIPSCADLSTAIASTPAAAPIQSVTTNQPLVNAGTAENPVVSVDPAALVASLCADPAFRECIFQLMLEGIQTGGGDLNFLSGTDTAGNPTFTPCP